MSLPQTANVIPLQIPIAGLNKRDTYIAMGLEYASWILNFDLENQLVKSRKGYVIHSTISAVDVVLGLGNYRNTELYAYCQGDGVNFNRIYDITTTTASLDHTTGSAGATESYPFNFSGLMAFTVENDVANTSRQYNGSTWASFGFAYNGRGTLTYKGRVYLTNSKVVYYGGLAAITGTMTAWDTTSLFEQGDKVYWLSTLSSPSNNVNEQYFALGNYYGEILIYAGDYPEAANWEQVAKFKIPKLLGYRPSLEIGNDIYLITETGLVSIKKLFTNTSEVADSYLISGAITPYWSALVRAIIDNEGSSFSAQSSIAHWPEENKIYVLINGYIDNAGTYTGYGEAATMFVYNIITGSWAVHKITSVDSTYGVRALTYFDNGLYYANGNVVMRLSPTVYKDETYNSAATYSAYALELESAYTNFGSSRKYKKVQGFELIVKTDFDGGNIGFKSASDFGRKVSLVSNAALQDGYSSASYSVGVDGDYIQYRISGTSDTTSTDGYEIYSVGVSVE